MTDEPQVFVYHCDLGKTADHLDRFLANPFPLVGVRIIDSRLLTPRNSSSSTGGKVVREAGL